MPGLSISDRLLEEHLTIQLRDGRKPPPRLALIASEFSEAPIHSREGVIVSSNGKLDRGRYLFTSESVSMGHPDKVADQISDTVVDTLIAQDPDARVACETLVTTGLVVV